MVLNLVAVQVDHREAQVVVAPNQFAVFDTKCRKSGRIKPCPNIRVEGMIKGVVFELNFRPATSVTCCITWTASSVSSLDFVGNQEQRIR